jgi:hypothetical protein
MCMSVCSVCVGCVGSEAASFGMAGVSSCIVAPFVARQPSSCGMGAPPGSGTLAAGAQSDHLLLVAAYDAWHQAGAAQADDAAAPTRGVRGQRVRAGRRDAGTAPSLADREAVSGGMPATGQPAKETAVQVARRLGLNTSVLRELQVTACGVACVAVIVTVVTIQDSTSSRLLPGSSYR